MEYQLAIQLKDNGFPCDRLIHVDSEDGYVNRNAPTLEELIEALGDRFYNLEKTPNTHWKAIGSNDFSVFKEQVGETPQISVANLWLALIKK